MQDVSEYTFRVDEICRLGLHTSNQQKGADRYETIGKISTRVGHIVLVAPARSLLRCRSRDRQGRGGDSGVCTAGLKREPYWQGW